MYQLPKLKYRRDILVVNDMRKLFILERNVLIVFGPFTNFKMTTCEGQNFIETLWETYFHHLLEKHPTEYNQTWHIC